ncbi:MAG: hypothetical protein ACM3S0_03540 [Acidobacteriota bacterium]
MRSLRLEPRLVLLFAFSVFALAPLTAPGYFIYGHDARHSVYFLQMFDLSMRDGAWYPRWATDMVFGYGYPLWIILAPMPFFIGQAFHVVGFDFVSAVKAVDGLALFFSSLAMYLYASRVLNKNAGLVAAVAYTYVPYHLVDLYVRSAQAELVSFIFPPLVLWAFHQLAKTRQSRYIPLAALSYAGLVLAHISMAVVFTPIIGIYLILLFFSSRSGNFHWRFALYSFCTIALALGLAAVFLLPVLMEQKYLTSDPLIGGFFNYRKHFVNASQLLSPFWGYGYAGENGNDRFSLQLGLMPILLALVGLGAWKRVDHTAQRHMAFFALVVAAVVLAILPVSAGVWEPFSAVVAFVQFPWRLLIVAGFALAFLSGAALYVLADEGNGFVPALIVALMFVVASYAYTEPQHTEAVFNYQTQMEFEVKDRELLGDTIWMTGERPQDSPLVEQYLSGAILEKAVALDDGAKVEMLRHGGQSDEIRVQAATPTRVMFYTRYFPGWAATLDDKAQPLEPYGDQGLILVNVPAGSHIVRLRYEGTGAQQAGAIISGVSLLVTSIWIAMSRRKKANPSIVF